VEWEDVRGRDRYEHHIYYLVPQYNNNNDMKVEGGLKKARETGKVQVDPRRFGSYQTSLNADRWRNGEGCLRRKKTMRAAEGSINM
jgi:hypothetical protein